MGAQASDQVNEVLEDASEDKLDFESTTLTEIVFRSLHNNGACSASIFVYALSSLQLLMMLLLHRISVGFGTLWRKEVLER